MNTDVEDQSVAPKSETPPRRGVVALSPKKLSGVYLFAALIVVYAIIVPNFLAATTLQTIAVQQAVTAIVALGLTVALAAGVFDLSIGGVIGMSNIVVARLLVDLSLPIALAIALTLLVGTTVGLVNGLLVTKAKIDPFITTLGVNSVLLAGIVVVSQNQNILGVPPALLNLANGDLFGIPLPVYYVLVATLTFAYVLHWTPVGRKLYATGGAREVARLAGVPTERYIVGAYMCSGTVAALAGVLIVATVGTGSTQVGQSYLLPAFAAGFLGATQFFPGRFNVWGTVFAVYLLATGVKGLVLMGAQPWVTDLFNGLALLLAVGLSGLQMRRKPRRARPV